MIPFFRKIRKKLADDNKPMKYMRYAIGEIALVVIGILIALSINNWNEERKLIKLERDLLFEVKNGLEYDLEKLNISINDHRLFINSQDIILDWVDGKIEYNDSLSSHFLHTIFVRNFQSKDSPFETLKLIGLRIIINEALRAQISNLYDLEYQNLYMWQDDYKRTRDFYSDSLAEEGFEITSESGERFGRLLPIDPSKLKLNKGYILKLKISRGILNEFTNNIMVNIKFQIEKTIKMIDEELKK
jgi:hypothetical protein